MTLRIFFGISKSVARVKLHSARLLQAKLHTGSALEDLALHLPILAIPAPAKMPSSPARSTVDSEKTGQDGKCQWYLPSFGGSRPHFSRHTKESTPSTLYTFNNHSTAFWQDNDPDPYKMLASKFATLSTGVPVAQSTFNNAEKIFLVGSKSQRAIKKEDFVAACPDLVQYVVVSTSSLSEI